MFNNQSLEMIKGSQIRIDMELHNQSKTITTSSHSIIYTVWRQQDLKMFQDDRDSSLSAF